MNVNYIFNKSKDQPLWFKVLMTPLSWLFLGLLYLRHLVYRLGLKKSKRLEPRVISVGNISVGGTGKTPFVIALCERIVTGGGKPIILTRGYKSGLRSGEMAVLLGGEYIMAPDCEITLAADEAMMQSIKLPGVPVVICADRYWAAKTFLDQSKFEVTHWVLDDGFQHWKIKRDLDIVLLSKANPFGSGKLLPLGFLREPISELKRADLIVWSGEGDVSDEDIRIAKVYGRMFIDTKTKTLPPELKFGPSLHQDFSSLKIIAVSAIARPERFIESLRSVNIDPDEHFSLPDHQRFNKQELKQRTGRFDVVFTTEKDFWRDRSVFENLEVPVYTLPVKVELPEHIFDL